MDIKMKGKITDNNLENGTKKQFFIKTYGCQMNVYDSQRMGDILENIGYKPAADEQNAELVILNTCHIREKAAEKVFSDLGRIYRHKLAAQRQNKKMLIAVGGCVGQAVGEYILERAPYVDMVFGPQSFHKLPDMIEAAHQNKKSIELDFAAIPKFDNLPEVSVPESGAAFLSVQEGCDKFCSFCVVPYTRGAEFSRPVADIIKEAQALVNKGVLEITLLGQNVNAYHGIAPSGKEWGLAEIIAELAEIEGLHRIRYTTSHPLDMTDSLIKAHGTIDKLMPYLHLPIQSGSDNILRDMNRRHTASDYIAIIDKLRTARSDIAISSDFIVGFPGETDDDFRDTIKLVEHVKFAQAFSFKYSPRPGTPAAERPQIAESVKADRLEILQNLLNQQQYDFNKQSIGKRMEILFEKPGRYKGQLIGKSPYLQSVHVTDDNIEIGRIATVEIKEAMPNSLSGKMLNNINKAA